MKTDRLTTPWWALRAALGAAAFLAGLDQFFNIPANWSGFLSPLATAVLPVNASPFMHVIGIVEMVVGALILAGYTRHGGYVAVGVKRIIVAAIAGAALLVAPGPAAAQSAHGQA